MAQSATDDVHAAMDWLVGRQADIEPGWQGALRPVFVMGGKASLPGGRPRVLADDKTGKEQAECGLTCDLEGRPAAVEVFAGNTTDPSVFIKALDGLGEATGA